MGIFLLFDEFWLSLTKQFLITYPAHHGKSVNKIITLNDATLHATFKTSYNINIGE